MCGNWSSQNIAQFPQTPNVCPSDEPLPAVSNMSAARHRTMLQDEAVRGLDKLLYILHQPGSYIISRCLEIALGIDTDDRFRIGRTQMHPIAVKLYL